MKSDLWIRSAPDPLSPLSLSSYIYAWLFPSSISSRCAFCLTHSASLLLGITRRSRPMSTEFLLSKDSRGVACLFSPVVTFRLCPCFKLTNKIWQWVDGHLWWLIRLFRCQNISVASCESLMSLEIRYDAFQMLYIRNHRRSSLINTFCFQLQSTCISLLTGFSPQRSQVMFPSVRGKTSVHS